MFPATTMIDVTGKSKGKGFQGVIKRYNFAGGPKTHGSKFHRTTGSIGNRATPGRVWKNKKMPGHMGCEIKTTQNLQVVEVNADKGYMLIRGSVPGSKNSWVKISKAVKK
jgi:large subunit ribosomal protein L3